MDRDGDQVRFLHRHPNAHEAQNWRPSVGRWRPASALPHPRGESICATADRALRSAGAR